MNIEMRGDSVVRKKKTNDIYANCLDQFGVLDITIRKRQQRIYIPCDSTCDSSGASKQL